jgi:hypothetical protein
MNKIISISIWGNKPQYCIGAIKNAKLAKKLLPDWKCRFFVDHTVPIEYQKQLYDMDNVEVAEVDSPKVFGAFWRFYSMFDSDSIVVSRDSDSRISEREVRCVNEWIESDKKFSIIRDHERHYDWPILAGMWGVKGSLGDDVYEKMNEYTDCHFYTADQIFLKDVVWDIAKEDCFIHGFKEIEWMNNTRNKDFIGQGYTENDEPLYSYDSSGKKI